MTKRLESWVTMVYGKDYKPVIELQKGGRQNVCMRDFLSNHM